MVTSIKLEGEGNSVDELSNELHDTNYRITTLFLNESKTHSNMTVTAEVYERAPDGSFVGRLVSKFS